MEKKNNPASVGNQFGYICPQCKQGDRLTIAFSGFCCLVPDGTEDDGDHEWDNDSIALCGCQWQGTVRELEEIENFEGGE